MVYRALALVLLFAPSLALAQVLDVEPNYNYGEYIIDYLLRGASFTAPDSSLFGAVSGVLSAAVFSAAVIVIAYNGAMAAWHTAQKGVPSGERTAGMMTVVRTAVAVSMITPILGNGHSPVQALGRVVNEWSLIWGDTANEAAVNYIKQEGSIANAPLTGMTPVVTQVLQNEICAETVRNYHNFDPTTPDPILRSQNDPIKLVVTLVDDVATYSWDYNPVRKRKAWEKANPFRFATGDGIQKGACGTVTMTLPSELRGSVKYANNFSELQFLAPSHPDYTVMMQSAKRQQDSFKNLRSLGEQAARYIMYDQKLLMLAESSDLRGNNHQSTIEHFYRAAEQSNSTIGRKLELAKQIMDRMYGQYSSDIRAIGKDAARYVNDNLSYEVIGSDQKKTWADDAIERGFIGYGAYYWTAMKVSRRTVSVQKHYYSSGKKPFVLHAPDDSGKYQCGANVSPQACQEHIEIAVGKDLAPILDISRLAKDRINTLLPEFYKTNIKSRDNFSLELPDLSDASSMWNEENWFEKYWLKGFSNGMSAFLSWAVEGPPGDLMLDLVNVGIVLTTASEALLILAIGLVFATSNPLGTLAELGTNGLISKLLSFVTFIIIAFAALGIFLQFVLPAIPLFKWIVSVHSWAITLILLQVFGPLWMLSHAMATGDHWVSEHSRNGYMLLLEGMFRPLLMVMGLTAAMSMMFIADLALNIAIPFLTGLADDALIAGPISATAIAVITCVMIYRLVMRSFDLIEAVPDFVFERLAQLRSMGDALQSEKMSGNVLGAWAATKSEVGHGGTGAAMQNAKSSLAQDNQQRPQYNDQANVASADSRDQAALNAYKEYSAMEANNSRS